MHILGVVSAISALFSRRSSQSAIAWALSCIMFPYLAVPVYWLLGASRFHGYVLSRRSSNRRFNNLMGSLRKYSPDRKRLPEDFQQSCRVFEELAVMPFTRGNSVELLINGEAAFESIFEHILQAREYIIVQFFIVRADALGRKMLNALAQKVSQGVRVYFLYDQIGSHSLSKRYINSLEKAGINVRAFKTMRRWPKRFQINFRNHRKMVIVDGKWAATGGANLGEEYCGRSKRFGYWRDTMIGVSGPAVQEIQLSFAEDWFFVTDEMPEFNWIPEKAEKGKQSVLVLPTAPANE